MSKFLESMRQSLTKGNIRSSLAIMVTVGYFIFVGFVLQQKDTDTNEKITLISATSPVAIMVLQYYFGGSKDTDPRPTNGAKVADPCDGC